MPDIIKENKETGELDVYNEKGEKIGTQSRKEGHIKKTRKTRVVHHVGREIVNVLTPEIKKRVINLALEGKSITDIAKEIGKARLVLFRWFINHPEFRKDFDEAKKVRSYYIEDEMTELVKNTKKKNDVPVNKFKFDALKTLGEINNPDRFTKKQQITESNTKPIQIIFSTGIDRSVKKELKDITVDVSSPTTDDKPAQITHSEDADHS